MASFVYFQTLGGLVARKVEDDHRCEAGGAQNDGDAGPPFADRWFFDSSFDLKHGLVVHEVAPEAIPQDAFERLFHL
jgi:hypothetical protein